MRLLCPERHLRLDSVVASLGAAGWGILRDRCIAHHPVRLVCALCAISRAHTYPAFWLALSLSARVKAAPAFSC